MACRRVSSAISVTCIADVGRRNDAMKKNQKLKRKRIALIDAILIVHADFKKKQDNIIKRQAHMAIMKQAVETKSDTNEKKVKTRIHMTLTGSSVKLVLVGRIQHD